MSIKKSKYIAINFSICYAINAFSCISLQSKNLVEEIKAITNGGANYAIETTELGMLLNQGLDSLRPLGTTAEVGVIGEVSIDIFSVLMSEGVIEGNAIRILS